MKKKILSIALSLCMVLTMMPMATGVAWAATGATADSVTIGGVTLDSLKPYYVDGVASAETIDGNSWTAKFEAGTLTLNGLVLNNESGNSIRSSGDLTIVLQNGSNNDIGHQNNESNIIKVDGALTITGPGRLTAKNGSSFYTTIYASGDITINGGAQVTATHAGGNAQAINAENGKIEILGNGTTVNATHSEESPTASNPFALMADNISVSNGAVLTATSGNKAVSGSVSIDTANSDVYAGDNAPGRKLDTISSTATYTDKYLKIAPKAPEATALEDRIFSYAYDAWRDPDFPSGTGGAISMSKLDFPINSSGEHGTTNSGSWKLTKVGTYSFIKSSNSNSARLDSIVNAVFGNYKDANPSLQKDAIVIHELKDGETHIAYGVVIAYDATNGTAVFIGDTWIGGACYLLSINAISGNTFEATAGTIATDFVQNISISLSQTEQYTFPAATVGYTSLPSATITVTNTGNTETGALTVALSGNNADSFTLSPNSINSISTEENNKTATFDVAPKTGLTAGTYTATVTVSGQNIVSKSFDVSFKVNSPSNPGGSYTPTIQKPTIIADEGVETTLSIFGDKLTIKVADGYEITDVIVNGVSKGKVNELTGLKTGDKVEVKTEKKQEEPKEPTKEEIIAALDSSNLVARSKLITLKNGKKAVRITWYDKNGNEFDFDGVEIYRSTQRYKGYGLKPFYATKGGKTEGYYVNTRDLKEGTTYFYKVRGYVEINGQKYYTDYSLKAIRTIK